jgi:glycosyltransferase involved in cell wall biosynthesis
MIRFCTPTRSHMGYAEMGRSVIAQLLRAGKEVTIQPINLETSSCDHGPRSKIDHLIGQAGVIDTNIVNMIPPLFRQHKKAGVKNIGFTTFEASSIPKEWVAQCNEMDAIWVTSHWNREVFGASGVTVPISVVSADADTSVPPHSPLDGSPFIFLSSFQWSARKNPEALLRAFCAAFDGVPDVMLVIKTHSNPRDKEPIATKINGVLSNVRCSKPPKIRVVDTLVAKAKLDQLHSAASCFLSLSHAEGWGLPAWQASVIGCPVIHTAYSAPNEFVHPHGLVSCNLSPVYGMEQFVPFFDTSMMWGEPHLDDAIDRMRMIFRDSEFRTKWREDAKKHAIYLQEKHSEENMAKIVALAL